MEFGTWVNCRVVLLLSVLPPVLGEALLAACEVRLVGSLGLVAEG